MKSSQGLQCSSCPALAHSVQSTWWQSPPAPTGGPALAMNLVSRKQCGWHVGVTCWLGGGGLCTIFQHGGANHSLRAQAGQCSHSASSWASIQVSLFQFSGSQVSSTTSWACLEHLNVLSPVTDPVGPPACSSVTGHDEDPFTPTRKALMFSHLAVSAVRGC